MGKVRIFNSYVNDNDWQNRDRCGFVIDEHIADVWRIGINVNRSLAMGLEALLTPAELDRANRYLQLKDKVRFIISRAGLRIILGNYLHLPPMEITFALGENKKPYIDKSAAKKINYNVSHAGNCILIAISESPVGADVEFINRTFDYWSIVDDFFNIDEVAYVREASSIERFYKVWTRKEAITKGTGKGLDENMKMIPGTDGAHEVDAHMIHSSCGWAVNSFMINNDYAASIAMDNKVTELRFFHFDF